ncbi:hypothetical protein VSR68_30570 [Paraburkholderia phymatum]|uniref:hypothetical protein n=1 Tax=Paraburkholderia phymatum TaxID=148447 RepID=UPI00317B0EC4
MSRLTARYPKRLADRSEPQHPRPRLRQIPVEPVPEFRFPDFAIAMKAFALVTVCLLVAIPLLMLFGLLVASLCMAI